MRRTPEWLEEYTRKQRNRQTAREWNGNVEPVSLKTIIAGAPTRKDGDEGSIGTVSARGTYKAATPATPIYPLVTLCPHCGQPMLPEAA